MQLPTTGTPLKNVQNLLRILNQIGLKAFCIYS